MLNPQVMSHAGGAADDEINLREVVDVIWSGKWIVAGITLASVILGVAYALIAAPVFQADGLVQVEEEKSSISATMDQLSSLIGGGTTQAPAEIAVLKSRMVLGSVVESLKLYIDVQPDYFPVFGQAVARRRADLTEVSLPSWLGQYAWGGEILKVTSLEVPANWQGEPLALITTDKGYELQDEKGALLLAGVVGQRSSVEIAGGTLSIFVQELKANLQTRFWLVRKPIQAAISDLDASFAVTEQSKDSGVLRLQVQSGTPEDAAQLVTAIEETYLRQNVERRSAQAEQSLEFLKKQLPDLKSKVDAAQARLNSYQLQKGTVDVQRETDLVLTQSVNLETQRLQMIQERDAAMQRFTAQHPVVVTLNEQIRGIERELDGIRKKVETLPEKQQEILSLMRDLEVNEGLYTALLNSAQQLQVTKAGTVGNVRIIDSGLPPLRPIKPRKSLIVMISGVLGAFLGVMAVFAMRMLLRGVDRPEDVERAIGLPTYASIPYSNTQARLLGIGKRSADGILATVTPDDTAVEALRSLRTSLHFAMLEAANNIVMISGPTAGLGKSFVSINFGAVVAASGKRIIVIDADMRRGRLARHAGVSQKPGLSDYIAGAADLMTVVHATSTSGLDFIASGTRPPNPSEILMNDRFSDLLKMLSKSYDYVLIDTPPVLPVTDAAIIGRMAGTTLLVLKAAEHPMRAIEETVRRLRQAGVQVRGMIFNQVGARVGSYGYGAYGYAYGYSSYAYKSRSGN